MKEAMRQKIACAAKGTPAEFLIGTFNLLIDKQEEIKSKESQLHPYVRAELEKSMEDTVFNLAVALTTRDGICGLSDEDVKELAKG